MIPVALFKDRLVGIVGLGRSGRAAARALNAGGARVIGWDDDPARRTGAAECELAGPERPEWDQLAALVSSPGVPLHHPAPAPLIARARSRGIEIIGDFELFARANAAQNAPVAAITGTNGKSTAVSLLAHILRACGFAPQAGGNLGLPVLALEPPEANTVYVLEISSFQIDLAASFAPAIAVQLNIAPDHTERHGGLEAYAAAKARLFDRQDGKDCAIIGVDDPFGRRLAAALAKKPRGPRVVPVHVGENGRTGVFFHDGVLHETGEDGQTRAIGPVEGRSLAGRHNRQNAAAAYAAARALGCRAEDICEAFKTFSGLPHRMETVRRIGKIRFINDSKATNAYAAAAALRSHRQIYWIAGGRAKPEGFAGLAGALGNVRAAFLFGEAAEALEAFLNRRIPSTRHESLGQAVRAAARAAADSADKDPAVLLSPACASFDQFSDFEARGAAFRRAAEGVTWSAPAPIAIAAGGTGGHLFPAEALARALRRRGRAAILLTDRRARSFADPSLWQASHEIASGPVAGQGPGGLLRAAAEIMRGLFQSYRLCRAARPAVMIGFGGYPSVPPLLAALFARVPVCIHEQSAVLGRANRALAPLAQALAAAFPGLAGLRERQHRRLVLTGTPIRQNILRARGKAQSARNPDDPFRLAVFAGSQGARALGRVVPEALGLLPEALREKITAVHQCRAEDSRAVRTAYDRIAVEAELSPFFTDIGAHLAGADLVIARAGASTINELAAVGRAAILVPITGAAGPEQQANARFLAARGAGWIVEERSLSPETLARRLAALIKAPQSLARAARAAYDSAEELGCLNAADKLADLVEDLAGQPNARRLGAPRGSARSASAADLLEMTA